MKKIIFICSAYLASFFMINPLSLSGLAAESAMDRCAPLPKTVRVFRSSSQCGKVPTVALSGSYKNSFSAAFRWEDGSSSGQDRSPLALEDSSAFSSPYKAQRRIRTAKVDILCYGRFVNRRGFSEPLQLTIKRTTAPVVNRFCVNF